MESGRLQKVQDAFRQATGEPWAVRLELAPNLQSGIAAEGAPAQPVAEVAAPDPTIEAIKKSLDARMMRIDEGFGQAFAATDSDDETAWTATEEE